MAASSKRTLTAVFGLLLVFVVVGIGHRQGWVERWTEGSSAETVQVASSPPEEQQENVEQRIASLEQSMMSIQTQLNRIAQVLEDLPDADDGRPDALPAEGGPADDAADAEPEVLSYSEQVPILENAMSQADASDGAWAAETEIRISSAISGSDILSKASAHQSRCGGKLCKISVQLPAGMDYAEKEFYEDVLLLSLANELSESRFQTQTHPDGSIDIEMYASRRGYGLPTPEHPLGTEVTLDAPPPPRRH